MKTRFLGGSLAALLLTFALVGCGGKTGPGSATTSVSGTGSSSDALATVGDSQITRAQLDQSLEGHYGQAGLPELIDAQLLTEALKAKKGSVSDEEINAQIARLQEREPRFKELTDAGGPRLDYIKNQLRSQLTVQKLLTDGIAVDDTKAQAFYNKYATYYSTPTQNKLGILAASTKTRADQLSRSLAAKPDSFASLVDAQKKTNDQLAQRLSTANVGSFETPEEFGTAEFAPLGLPPQALAQVAPALAPLTKLLATAKIGQVLPVTALTPRGPFLIVKVIDRKEAAKPAFASVKDEVSVDYQLAQAAQVEVKKNPANPPTFDENIKRTTEGLKTQVPPGQRVLMRDILTYMLQPASQNLLTGLRTNNTVQISDPLYKDIAKTYTAPPGAAATGNSATGTAPAAGGATNSAASATGGATTNSTAPTTGGATTNSAAPATGGATNSATPAAGGTTNSAAPAKP